MGIDLKKEIKLSDLLKRGPKEPKAPKPPKEKKQKAEKPPKEPRERRFGKRAPREKEAALEPRSGPPMRDIPLMRAFNLLPSEEAVAAEREARRPSAIPHVIVALAGVLVFAALAAFYLSAGANVTKKTGELDDLRGDLASLQVPEQEPQSNDGGLDVDAERTARTAALSAALADRLAWDRVLRELALVLPSDVTLVTLDAAAPSPGSASAGSGAAVTSFAITGTSASQEGVARLLSRLQVIPELKSVTLEFSSSSDDSQSGSVNFSISAVVRQGAAA
ncbi:MAG TPA: PilN domain-containing protein [Gaiellaceae bacterium]|nr:PilN domain-containing protein [Gaiellaceae bacterium]